MDDLEMLKSNTGQLDIIKKCMDKKLEKAANKNIKIPKKLLNPTSHSIMNSNQQQ